MEKISEPEGHGIEADPPSIVIVDDNAADRELAQNVIRRLPISLPLIFLTSAAAMMDCLEGKGQYANRRLYPYPALILLDLEMPSMDGFEALIWLKSQPGHARVAVIALSGSGELPQVNRAYSLGVRSYLTKPLNSTDLRSALTILKLKI